MIIEIDGISHNDKSESDQIRQQKLESLGLSVLRFYEWDVKKDIHAVVEAIEDWIEKFEKKTQPLFPPLLRGINLKYFPRVFGLSFGNTFLKRYEFT